MIGFSSCGAWGLYRAESLLGLGVESVWGIVTILHPCTRGPSSMSSIGVSVEGVLYILSCEVSVARLSMYVVQRDLAAPDFGFSRPRAKI